MEHEVYCTIAKKVVKITGGAGNLYRCSQESEYCTQQLVSNTDVYCHQEMAGINPNWLQQSGVNTGD